LLPASWPRSCLASCVGERLDPGLPTRNNTHAATKRNNPLDLRVTVTHVDIVLCWVTVHGGSYHALLHLRDRLRREGLSCRVLLNSSPPLGLQIGLDLDERQIEALRQDDIHIIPLERMGDALQSAGARLCVFDSHSCATVGLLIRLCKDIGSLTAQISTLLADYTYHGADYLLIQHPISLWFVFDYSREPRAAEFAQAKGIFFSGNIFYEPLPNTWTSEIRTREQFLAKYEADADKPTCLWLPNREDGLKAAYGRVLEQVRQAGMNVMVKLHPWEYKQICHGFDPYGLGNTSAGHWGAKAISERDSSWALAFCDAGIMRGSSMGLELPFWRKPGIYLPRSGRHAPWHHLLVEMTQGCSVYLDDLDNLGAFLRSAWPLLHTDEVYDKAKRYTMPLGARAAGEPDSLALHARHLLAIMEGRAEEFASSPGGSTQAVRRLFEPDIPPSFYKRLRPRQRLLHAARRLVGLRPPYTV